MKKKMMMMRFGLVYFTFTYKAKIIAKHNPLSPARYEKLQKRWADEEDQQKTGFFYKPSQQAAYTNIISI